MYASHVSQLAGHEISIDISYISCHCSCTLLLQGFAILCPTLQGFFGHIGVHVNANSTILAQLQSLEAFVQGFGDLLLGIASLQSLNHTAHALDFLELSPNLLHDLLGQGFHCPRATGRVNGAQHAKFLLQHNVQVTGNTTGEYIALTNQLIKGRILIGINATYNAGEGLGAVTQHIYIGIDHSFGEAGATTMYHNGAVSLLSAKGFHNGCPYLTQSTQLSNFHKEVCTLVKSKIQGSSDILEGNTTFLHLTNILYSASKGVSDLLYRISATIGEAIAAHINRAN